MNRGIKLLELQNVSYQIDEKIILKDINLKINDHFVAVTGPNGSGKSTLAKIIAGISQPTSGKILLDGEDITDLSITERANKGISYAFQQPVRFKGLTVKDLMRLSAGKETPYSKLCEMLNEVGLQSKNYINRSLDASLSGGELKRIEIAMIFARSSKLSLFDEPEAGIGVSISLSVSLKKWLSKLKVMLLSSATRKEFSISLIKLSTLKTVLSHSMTLGRKFFRSF